MIDLPKMKLRIHPFIVLFYLCSYFSLPKYFKYFKKFANIHPYIVQSKSVKLYVIQEKERKKIAFFTLISKGLKVHKKIQNIFHVNRTFCLPFFSPRTVAYLSKASYLCVHKFHSSKMKSDASTLMMSLLVVIKACPHTDKHLILQ